MVLTRYRVRWELIDKRHLAVKLCEAYKRKS